MKKKLFVIFIITTFVANLFVLLTPFSASAQASEEEAEPPVFFHCRYGDISSDGNYNIWCGNCTPKWVWPHGTGTCRLF
ncbi:MAG: hypothetical protein US49_C0022G0004 [candidate division TM6 bacterium GW2011_GWF2_37_49]|jgi:hypothetical protein|nr:MAG: hypothetical protein US49_C0022G0004 [candidate division TM6 bacterium GW2011_GWF2_37_49]